MAFPYELDYNVLNFRVDPSQYRVGRGEQGVLLVQPYKSEILPYWRFATPAASTKSARAILRLFRRYRRQRDFVGMDMARKYIQMGVTRSRRYANHRSGRKYCAVTGEVLPREADHATCSKAECANIFRAALATVMADPTYQRMRSRWPR